MIKLETKKDRIYFHPETDEDEKILKKLADNCQEHSDQEQTYCLGEIIFVPSKVIKKVKFVGYLRILN